MNPIAKLAQVVLYHYVFIFRKHIEVDSKFSSRVKGYTPCIRSCFIPKKYGNSYQNPTASIRPYWEPGSRDPPLFAGVVSGAKN